MNNRKKWTSIQSITIITIILLIFVYIGFDLVKFKPQIKEDLKKIKKEYVELLDERIPEIDSILEVQTKQISSQSLDINNLRNKVKNLTFE